MTKQKQSRVRHQVDRRSLAEDIRDSLRERIVAGEFRDGDALIQELVAEEYGASRIPVREALRQLEACGLVSMETHKGTVVSTIPTEEVRITNPDSWARLMNQPEFLIILAKPAR